MGCCQMERIPADFSRVWIYYRELLKTKAFCLIWGVWSILQILQAPLKSCGFYKCWHERCTEPWCPRKLSKLSDMKFTLKSIQPSLLGDPRRGMSACTEQWRALRRNNAPLLVSGYSFASFQLTVQPAQHACCALLGCGQITGIFLSLF